MKNIVIVAGAALATTACMTGTPHADSGPQAPTRSEQRAEAMLEGRVAGPPVDCVNQRDLGGNRSLADGSLLFDGRTSGGIIYVNRPAAGCPSVNAGRALIVRTPSTRLCRGDIVNVVDPVNGMSYGSCGLGDFTPYRRAG